MKITLIVFFGFLIGATSLFASTDESVSVNGNMGRAFITDAQELAEFDAKITRRSRDKLKYEGTRKRDLLAYYYAKEFCSCIFVVGQSKKVCKRDVKHVSALMGVKIDRERKEIRTKSLLAKGLARYTGEKYGCVLIK